MLLLYTIYLSVLRGVGFLVKNNQFVRADISGKEEYKH